MDLNAYKESKEQIEKTYLLNRQLAFRTYSRLAAIFIQDSQGDIGTPYYGNNIINKGKILWEIQELFIYDL